jgi:polyisoprenoid-binding protein YceI
MRRMALGLLLALSLGPAAAAERALVPAKSEIAFSVKQMGVSVSGSFRRYVAQIDLDPAAIDKARAQIEIDTASLTTGDDEADAVATEKAWLDVAGFPKAAFSSQQVRALGGDRFEATGTLTIKGQSKPLTVPFSLKAAPDGSAVASGEFKIQRVAFGIGGGEWNEGDMVSPEVAIRFRLTLAPLRH